MKQIDPEGLALSDKVVKIRRVAKVMKGGRRFSFAALVVVGDGAGHVSDGYGKAKEIPDAIRKGIEDAKKNLIEVPLRNETITHPVIGKFGAARVLLKPASPGTGIIAGSSVRAVMELAGVHNVLSKSLGSSNALNIVRATMQGLRQLRKPEQVARLRDIDVSEINKRL